MEDKVYPIVDLYPYKIKNRKNFYDRDHPKNLNPSSTVYHKYYDRHLKYIIEGKWVNDEGTWVFMYPKLYHYINFVKLTTGGKLINPWLTDNEWIIFTYLMIVDGFSGFELEEEYTCHYAIKELEEGKELDRIQLNLIPNSTKKPNGDYKKFIYPWEYLTRVILVDRPGDPLGLPLFENDPMNGFILSARSIGKSVSVFLGDFLHEWLFPNIRKMSDIGYANSRWNFVMGSKDARPLKRSINAISSYYSNMDGYYKYPPALNKQDCKGAFYKRIQGSWAIGKEIVHIGKDKLGKINLLGNNLQMVALTADRLNVAAGDRFRRVYLEEAGFLKKIRKFYGAIKDSLQSQGNKVGSFIGTGTGGEMESIQGPKEVFTNPVAYDLATIPNYWSSNSKSRIGLFLPTDYANLKYKDPNGNTLLKEVREFVLKRREAARKESQEVYDRDVQFNPLDPNDMLRPSGKSWLPRQESAKVLARIEEHELFEKASIGSFEDNLSEKYGVEFKPDINRILNPILELREDDELETKEGAVIIYEHPPDTIQEGLYYVLYDPAAKSGDGESYHSVLVYKVANISTVANISDGIAAEWLGRLEKLDDNYAKVVRIAKYFNAAIFPERNITGFIEYMCRPSIMLDHMLERSATEIEKEVSPNSRKSYHPFGFAMQTKYKTWALKRLKSWLLRSSKMDGGVVVERVIDTIHSPRIHNEIIAYNLQDNFDHISSLLGLQFLLAKLDGMEIMHEEINEELDQYVHLEKLRQRDFEDQKGRAERPDFLQY